MTFQSATVMGRAMDSFQAKRSIVGLPIKNSLPVRARNEKDWSLAYLRSRARAFDMRTAMLASVAGAVEMALSSNASVIEVVTILSRYRLEWDQDRRVIRIQS